MYIIILIFIVATLAAFVLLLLRKQGAIEWVQVHGNKFFAEMFSCDFCLSWWTCVAISVAFALLFFEPLALIVPFFATPITRKLL